MPCHDPGLSNEDLIREMLCKACKLLSKEQMNSINVTDPLYVNNKSNLLAWYKGHLRRDCNRTFGFNEKDEFEKILKEIERLGWKIKSRKVLDSTFFDYNE